MFPENEHFTLFFVLQMFCPTELEVAGVIYKFHLYCFDLVRYSWNPNNNKYSDRDGMMDRDTWCTGD